MLRATNPGELELRRPGFYVTADGRHAIIRTEWEGPKGGKRELWEIAEWDRQVGWVVGDHLPERTLRGARERLQDIGGGDLPGRKPLAFCAWLFNCLGLEPGDELVDVFPGTGVVSRAWAELSRAPAAETDVSSASTAGSRRHVAQVLADADDGSARTGSRLRRLGAGTPERWSNPT